jgi:hypothetical protein
MIFKCVGRGEGSGRQIFTFIELLQYIYRTTNSRELPRPGGVRFSSVFGEAC